MSSKKGGFCNFLYDSETKLIMGRSGKQWAQLIFFYIIFYAGLVGFWIACLVGFLSTTNTKVPALLGFQSMLQLNPAIGYRPQPDFETNLIKFNASDPKSIAPYLKDSNTFLEQYFNESLQSRLLNCNDSSTVATTSKGCQFRPKQLLSSSGCFSEDKPPFSLGFANGTPCVILKMNRIYGWMPRNFENKTYQDIKVRCYGENEGDVETLGKVQFTPGGEDERGPYGLIQSKYFPFMSQDYLSPFVIARFNNVRNYTVALIWCEFDSDAMNFQPGVYWASRVLSERAGGAHFELLVDR